MVTGSRDTTTVATQALYLLNDPFVRRQSLALAERLLEQTELDDAGRVDLAYRLTLGRPATAAEIERAKSYLADYESAARELVAFDAACAEPRPSAVVAAVDADTTPKAAAKRPVPPVNPDEVDAGGSTGQGRSHRGGRSRRPPPGPASARRCSGPPSSVISSKIEVQMIFIQSSDQSVS